MTLAVASAVFVWWFSTGAIFWAVSRHAANPGWLVAFTAPLALLAGVVLIRSGDETAISGAYAGFLAAIGLWGWFELAFLAGVITGPNREECPPGARGWRRFRAAWSAVAYHEIALLAAVLVLLAITWEHANRTGLWTFLVLFFARISAKLNVYVGVPNLSDGLLPRPVAHLRSYFAQGRASGLFAVSVAALTVSTLGWGVLAEAAPAGSGAEAGFVLLATLTAIALVEHWLMVLPVSETALWGWLAPKTCGQAGRAPGPAE